MSGWLRFLLVANMTGLLLGCSEEPESRSKKTTTPLVVKTETTRPDEHSGHMSIMLRPEQPTSSDCLRVVAQGQAVRAEYHWFVNGSEVDGQTGSKLCNDFFKRDDEVSVSIGSEKDGASVSVIIGNSPPQIGEVSSTENQVVKRGDITFLPVAQDIDGDEIKFRYQWLINDEEDFFHVESTLPGESYVKGDTVQVKIVPYDEIDEGTAYESAVLTVPNAAPIITSQPPQQFESLVYSYQIEAKDPDDTELTYNLEEAPPGMTINESGMVTWPMTGVSTGTYKVKIAVEDPEGTRSTQELSIILGKGQK